MYPSNDFFLLLLSLVKSTLYINNFHNFAYLENPNKKCSNDYFQKISIFSKENTEIFSQYCIFRKCSPQLNKNINFPLPIDSR